MASYTLSLRHIARRSLSNQVTSCYSTTRGVRRRARDEWNPTSAMANGYEKKLNAAYGEMQEMTEEEAFTISMEDKHRIISAPGEYKEQARQPKLKQGFVNMNVQLGQESEGQEHDEEFENDDISAMAHGELEEHRELRHYARLAAWEMPLLTSMAKEYVPPTGNQILRFRKTSYMGEQHPAANKVVMEFCPSDIPNLTAVQLSKLQKLLGSRYRPINGDWERGIAKMSCEKFGTIVENRAELRQTLKKLVIQAMDDKDTFEDVPLDKRHYKVKVKPKFPREWRVQNNGERMALLTQQRQEALEYDQQKERLGLLIDGVKMIEDAVARMPALEQAPEAEMAMARAGTKKKGAKTIQVKRY